MRAGLALLLLVTLGCDAPANVSPAAAAASASTVAPTAPSAESGSPAGSVAVSAAAAPSDAGASAATSASSAAAPAKNALEDPALLAADGGALPQTEDEPSVDDPWFQAQLALLWEAIVHDDAERARSVFFPVVAYEQVKAIKEPAKDWKYRLWKNFVRDVHEYHKRLGKGRDGAKLVRLELRNEPAWMKPGKEGNLLGYWRVTRSYLHFEWADGKKSRFDLTSMISWRGKWYVVHLHGFS